MCNHVWDMYGCVCGRNTFERDNRIRKKKKRKILESWSGQIRPEIRPVSGRIAGRIALRFWKKNVSSRPHIRPGIRPGIRPESGRILMWHSRSAALTGCFFLLIPLVHQNIFISSSCPAVSFESKERKTLQSPSLIFASILKLHQWIFNSLHTSELLGRLKLLGGVFWQGKLWIASLLELWGKMLKKVLFYIDNG